MSPIDDLFYRLMGYYPSKPGQAYELLATAIVSLVSQRIGIHDVHRRGLSKTDYQIDGLIDGDIMLGAKDYTIQNKKVGRGDLQKQQGALSDLDTIREGYFISATDYTEPALKYAQASQVNPNQSPITPIYLRPSTPDDEKNRIKGFIITQKFCFLDIEHGQYTLEGEPGEKTDLVGTYLQSKASLNYSQIRFFYNQEGHFIKELDALCRERPPKYQLTDPVVIGRLDIDAYVRLYGNFYHIYGVNYSIPIDYVEDKYEIFPNGDAAMLIRCEALGLDKLITDKDIISAIQNIEKNKAQLRSNEDPS